METKTKNKVLHLRIPPALYESVAQLANKKEWSINHYVVATLEEKVKRSPSMVSVKDDPESPQNQPVAPKEGVKPR